MRYYLIILKILNALLFIWIFTIFFNLFDFEAILTTSENEIVILDVIFVIKNLLSYAFFSLFFIIALGISYLIGGMFIPFVNFNNLQNLVELFFRNMLNLWFVFPDGSSPELTEIPGLILEEALVLLEDLYLFLFQILFVLSIIFLIRAIYKSDPKYNMFAVGSLILMIIIPLIFFGFRDMLDLFGAVQLFNNLGIINLNELADPLSGLFNDLPINDFFVFLSNPISLFAISCYLYLEMAFQINYTDNVTKPTLERSDRLEAQLNLLRKESIHITANIDKIREEAKTKKEELGVEAQATSKFLTKQDKRFSYVKEMIEKKKLESEEKQLIRAASKTRRLGRYIDRLFREDPEAEDTLTAKTSAPKARNLATSTIINSSFRIVMLILLSYIIIHPQLIFSAIFQLPPAITESMATFSPEIIIILLVPIILLFPLIAQIISYIKHRSLILRLKQEGKIKEILASVGDYVKMEDSGASEELEDESSDESVSQFIPESS